MAALPYMQLYVADYLADTAHLNAQQHGAYLLLLFNYWQRGKPLKNSNERLANVARMSNEEWENNKDLIAEFFTITDDEWIHDRIERDLEAVNSKSNKAKQAGKASAAKRLNERSTNVKQTFNHTDTDTDTDTDKKKNIKKENSVFDQFWKEYPKKSGKHEALKAWNKKSPPIDKVLNALHWQKVSRQWSEGFIPNPATYINQGRWEDEPEKINVMPLPRGSPSFKTQQAEINARSIFGVNHERDITEESREFENRKIT